MKQSLPSFLLKNLIFSFLASLHAVFIFHYKFSYYSVKSGCIEQKNFKLWFIFFLQILFLPKKR